MTEALLHCHKAAEQRHTASATRAGNVRIWLCFFWRTCRCSVSFRSARMRSRTYSFTLARISMPITRLSGNSRASSTARAYVRHHRHTLVTQPATHPSTLQSRSLCPETPLVCEPMNVSGVIKWHRAAGAVAHHVLCDAAVAGCLSIFCHVCRVMNRPIYLTHCSRTDDARKREDLRE